jgi:hypothetical protein
MIKPLSTIVDLVRQFGGPVSHAALDPSHCTFGIPAVDGLISFLLVRRCAVVLGDPICAPENKFHLADSFADYCAVNGWSILYVAATASLQAYASKLGYGSMEFAGLLLWPIPVTIPRHARKAAIYASTSTTRAGWG